MKTILVATDFSAAAINAAKYATDMAKSINASLLLLHTYQMPVSYSEIGLVMSAGDLQQIAEKDMQAFKEKLVEKTGASMQIDTEVRMGAFMTELKEVCERVHPYTVVMGSQGTTATERFFFGSHAVNAMKNLAWPLITVPPTAGFTSVKRVGLACDFDKVVDTIPVDEVKGLLADFNAELHVLNTAKKDVYNPDIVFESGLLQEMFEGLAPQYHFIANENTDAGILEFAENNQIDLLLVLPKRHSLMERLTHKSHTREFVLHSHMPVMALHQQ